MNEDIRTKQDLLFEVSSLNTQLSNELIKNEELQQRIDKAIEYIENNIYYSMKDFSRTLNGDNADDLLEILRGKQND